MAEADNKAVKINDRRTHGNAKRISRKVQAPSNLLDQRKAGAYAPKPPSAKSNFDAGVAAGRPIGAGAGKPTFKIKPLKTGEK